MRHPEAPAHAMRNALRLTLSLLVLAGLAASWAPRAHAQGSFPTKPIVIINPNTAGGTTDLEVIPYIQKLMELSGWKAVLEARPGGGGTIGYNYVARSAPDGY